jgi:hypothetical protein
VLNRLAFKDLDLATDLLALIVSDQKKKSLRELEEAKVITYGDRLLTYREAAKIYKQASEGVFDLVQG